MTEAVSKAISAAVASSLSSGGTESLGFLNDIVVQLWPYINVAGAQMTKDIVEPMFKEMLPGPLSSLHFTKIDLGKKPIKFDNIDVHNRHEGVIKLDLDVSWDGNCDIELKAKIIGGLGVESVKLQGRLSVLLCPLIERMPLVGAAQIAFVNPPKLELDFTGLAQVADLSVIDDTVRKIIQDVLASMLVLPNRLLVKLDPTNDYFKTYHNPMGFLRLTIVRGHGFKTPKGFMKDVPDTYVKVFMGAHPMWRTKTIKNDLSPEYDEMHDFLLSDHDQQIKLDVLDDDLASDDDIGDGSITVSKLLLNDKKGDVPLAHKGSDIGATLSLACQVYELTPDVASFEASEHSADGLMVGLVTVLVASATGVPGEKEDVRASVKVSFGSKEFSTPVVCDTPGIDVNNPSFDSVFRVPLSAEAAAAPSDFSLTLVNKKEKIGTIVVPWADVLSAPDLTLSDSFKTQFGSTIRAQITIRGTKLAE